MDLRFLFDVIDTYFIDFDLTINKKRLNTTVNTILILYIYLTFILTVKTINSLSDISFLWDKKKITSIEYFVILFPLSRWWI